MNVSATRGREIKNERARELDELRSKGRTKSLRDKLKDFTSPLQTAEEAKQFLLDCRDQSKRESFSLAAPHEQTRPATMNSVDYDSFLMMQYKREQELKLRRKEAVQLLHGFRGSSAEIFGKWSPRKKPRGRTSFGFGDTRDDSSFDFSHDHSPSRRQSSMPRLEHTDLGSRDHSPSRRQSSMPRLENNWTAEGRDDHDQFGESISKLERGCSDFLNDGKHYDGTQYPRTSQDMEVADGVSMFNIDRDCDVREGDTGTFYDEDGQFRDRIHQSDHPIYSNDHFVNGHQEYVESQYPDKTTNQDMDVSKDAVLFGDDVVLDANPEQNKSISSSSPYKARDLNLEVRSEREDRIDVTASEERLRQAGSICGSGRDEFDVNGSMSRESEHGDHSRHQTLDNANDEVGGDNTLVQENHNRHSPLSKTPVALPEDPVYHEPQSPIPETVWRDFISNEPGAKYPAEAGRYHLYASYACPGSHRALIVRALKGLEDIVSVTIVHPTWRHTNPNKPSDKHRGWIFGDPDGQPFHNTMGRGGPFPPAFPDNTPDPIMNAYSVRNLYEYANDTSGKYTIPLLWDTKLNTIVNNESSDISYMLNSSFNEFTENPNLDLYTEDDEDGLDRLNEVSQWLYPMMIHGVYRCGFAKTQRAYDQAIEELTEAFDAADELLQNQRYLTGDTLTDADIRLFVTLLRFDEVYAFYFRANTRLVMMTPALLNFCREIYHMPGVAETCQMDQIKAHFFGSHAEWNKYSVVPRGLGFMRYLDMPHDREKLEDFGRI